MFITVSLDVPDRNGAKRQEQQEQTSRDVNSGSVFFNGEHLDASPNVSATLHRERDLRRAPTSKNASVFKGNHDAR